MERTKLAARGLANDVKGDFIINAVEGNCNFEQLLNYIQDCSELAVSGDMTGQVKLFAMKYVSSRYGYNLLEDGLATPSNRSVEEACFLYLNGYKSPDFILEIYLNPEWDQETQSEIDYGSLSLTFEGWKCVRIHCPSLNVNTVDYDNGLNIPDTIFKRWG